MPIASQLQLRRGTTPQHAVFTGAPGEVTVDTDKKTVVVHDGTTQGGFPLSRESVIATGSVTRRSISDRFAEVLNVKDYGAKGDGVTNDTAAIQAVFDKVRALQNNENLTKFYEIVFPSGYYCVQNLNLFTRTGVFIRGPRVWNRNRPAGAVLQPFDGTERHLLRVGFYNQDGLNPVSPVDNFASSISIDGLHFCGATNISTTRTSQTLSDALLVFDAAYSCDIHNVQFSRANGRAVRLKNCFEMRWTNIAFEFIGAWNTSVFKVDPIYSGGGNNSAMWFNEFHWEACKGTLFEMHDGAIDSSDFQFNTWNIEWGAFDGQQVISDFATDVDTYVPLILLRGFENFQVNDIVTTNIGRYYVTDGGTTYSHDAIVEVGTSIGITINGIGILQSKQIAAVSTVDGSAVSASVSNVFMSSPLPDFVDVYYRFRSKTGIVAEIVRFSHVPKAAAAASGNSVAALSRINSNPPLLGYVPAVHICQHRADWVHKFVYDTDSLWHNRQTFFVDRTSAQPNVAAIPFAALTPVRSSLRVRIRAKAFGDTTCVPRIVIFFTDNTSDVINFPTITDTSNYAWVDCIIGKKYFDGTVAKTIRNIILQRGTTASTTDGSFYFDGLIIEPMSENEAGIQNPFASVLLEDGATSTVPISNDLNPNRRGIYVITANTTGDGSCIVSSSGAALFSIHTGGDFDVGTTDPDTAGKINVYLSGNSIALHNKFGSTRRVAVYPFPANPV